MKPITIHKLKCFREDLNNPFADCYTPQDLIAIRAASQVKATITEKISMSYNQNPSLTGVSPSAVEPDLAHVHGVTASNDPGRLVQTLARLGLVSDSMCASLTTLAAAKEDVGKYFKVRLYDLDAALKRTGQSLENRLMFKASLSRANLIQEQVR